MIGSYDYDSDEARLGKLEAENARQLGAQRRKQAMREKLLKMGVTPAELETNVGVMTVAENWFPMPPGHIIGVKPVEALEAVLAGAAAFLPDHQHQKPPAWVLKALETFRAERARPAPEVGQSLLAEVEQPPGAPTAPTLDQIAKPPKPPKPAKR